MNNYYYVMRHGESIANRKKLIISSPEIAATQYGLTSFGADQVMSVCANSRLKSDCIIISSDFLRAKESAEIVHSILSIKTPIAFEPLLRERDFGDLDQQDHSHYDLVWQNDVNEPLSNANGVETVSQVLNRSLTAIDKIEAQYQNKKVLLVGHGDPLQILSAHFQGTDPRFHRSFSVLKNAEIRRLSKSLQQSEKVA